MRSAVPNRKARRYIIVESGSLQTHSAPCNDPRIGIVLSEITHTHHEETIMKKSSWFVLIVCTLLASSAAAQNKCTFHTTHARYGTSCQGFVSTAPGAAGGFPAPRPLPRLKGKKYVLLPASRVVM